MCGRGRCTLRPDGFSRACYLDSRPVRHLDMDRFRPSYNVAPGFNVPVVRRDDGGDGGDGVVSHCMKWGLVPSFTKQSDKIDHFKMFNARSESIREKASFRRLLPKNRCLVSFEGFYEWIKDGTKKQPYYIHFKDDRPLVFAALFDSWKSAEGEVLYTFTIITTSSSSSLEWLHDRMPVILGNKESTESWLNDSSLSNLDKILKPYEETDLVWYPVTPAIGKISFDGPDCIKEVKLEETKTIQVKLEETKTISQFFSKKLVCKPKEPELEETPTTEDLQECSATKSKKEEPENRSTLENTTLKDEPIDKSVTEEPEKGEPVGSNEQKRVKEEPDRQEEDEEKHDYVELSGHAKPFAKELHISPVKKRRKGANDKQTSNGVNDKQPTLFSYFGKN